MRHAKVLRGALILALVVGGAMGCTGTTGHLAVATTRPLDPRSVALDACKVRPRRHVVGRSCIKVVGIVPLGMPNFGDALEDALRRTGADRLSNVVVGYEVFDIPMIYGVACYVVEGDA
ncbi:MAG TPA: hypothetical protein VKU61_08375 [Candidatus Binatia bacterium]|nr:hypothetical protein [Candidatus Binatia bacterium]